MLTKFLQQKRERILEEWLDQTINTYEPEMVRFLKKEKNQFSNPVRNTIITSLEKIFDGIVCDNGVGNSSGLEDLIKVRAVQNFSPSEALSFLFGLKKIIRTELLRNEEKSGSLNDLYMLDQKFDTLLRQAFDYYNDCRMKINDIKISEIKARSERAFEIMNKTTENTD
jgi:hypothetical protein